MLVNTGVFYTANMRVDSVIGGRKSFSATIMFPNDYGAILTYCLLLMINKYARFFAYESVF